MISKILRFFKEIKFVKLLLIFGILLICIGSIEITSKPFTSSSRSAPLYLLIILGVIFALIAITIYMLQELPLLKNGEIYSLKKGFGTKISKNTEINILFDNSFDNLPSLADNTEDTLIVLPVNEFFDEECITNPKGCTRIYIDKKDLHLNIKDVQQLIEEELRNCKSEPIKDLVNEEQNSYGIGTGVLLKHPSNNSQESILFVAVTTKRFDEGVRSESSYIFKAVKKIYDVAKTNIDLNNVWLPLLGSGRGGLKKELALFSLIYSIFEEANQSYGINIKKFNIVIYQDDDENSTPISKLKIKQLLKIIKYIFK